MNIFTNAVCFLALAIAFSTHSNAEVDKEPSTTTLSDYSTEAIIKEYHRRLDLILDVIDPIDQKLGDYMAKRSTDGESWEITKDETFAEFYIELQKVGRDLIPFAQAGNIDAQGIIGPLGMYGLFGEEWICPSIQFTSSAAKKGSYLAAPAMIMKYDDLLTGRRINAPIEIRRKHQFWTLETAHKNPAYHFRRDNLLEDLATLEKTNLIQEWMDWNTFTADTDDLLEGCKTARE